MKYADCLLYLERLGNEVLTMKFGLDTIRALLHALENPHLAYPSVIIAGTNGKGSVARFLDSILREAGLATGLYTSPHLVRLEERFSVRGEFLSQDAFSRYFTRVVETIQSLDLPYHPTYFETVTAVAFLCFQHECIDLAVLEVGMGGRLDSTNVVKPLLSVITPVGLDHQKFLGNTLAEIAREKAGIIHPGCPVVVAPQKAEAREVIVDVARSRGSAVVELDCSEILAQPSPEGKYRFSYQETNYQLNVFGRHQIANAALAVRAAEMLGQTSISLSREAFRRGIENTRLLGVLQRVRRDPSVFLDGAHNPDSMEALAHFLKEHAPLPRALMYGAMRDKDITSCLTVLRPLFDTIYLTSIDSPRAASVEELKSAIPDGLGEEDLFQAYRRAIETSAATVVLTGSFYLVGQFLAKWEGASD